MKERGSGFLLGSLSFVHSFILLKGNSYPESCVQHAAHSAMLRSEDFLISFIVAEAGRHGFSFLFDFM